jgi:anaerobic selenocysteine-containing dehydrogenase
MAKKAKPETKVEKTFIKGLSLIGSGVDSGYPCAVDVKNGKIIRLRPLHYDWQYDRKQFNPWKIEAHGKTFEPGMRSLPSTFGLAYKKRVFSPNRILYPLKRIDWNPDGDRNVENRGKSKYVRISWDEALKIIVDELRRVKEKYGMEAVLSQADMHGEGKVVHVTHASANKLLALMGGYTAQLRNPDSWEGWAWGAKHVWGMEPVGQQVPTNNLIPDIAQNSNIVLFWGCDPETTPW